MHFERAQRDVSFVAVLAAKRFLHLITLGGGTVELLVFGEAGEGGVGLLTVGALIAWRRRLVLLGGGRAGRRTALAGAQIAFLTI